MKGGTLGKSQAVFASAAILLALNLGLPPAVGAVDDAAATTEPSAAASIEQEPIRRTPAAAAATKSSRPTTQKAGVASKPATKTGYDPIRVTLALGAVLVLILLARWAAKKFLGVTVAPRSTRAVQVLSRSPLSPRQQVVLLRVGRRLVVVADGGTQVSTLSEITDPDEVAALLGQLQEDHGERAGKAFGTFFGKMRGRYENGDDVDDSRREFDDPEDDPAGSPQAKALDREAFDADDPASSAARKELNGLMDKVRLLSRQFKS